MSIFFCPVTVGFYDDQINSVIPESAFEIPDGDREALMEQISHGRILSVDENGQPVVITPPVDPETYPALIAAERYKHETGGIIVGGMPIDTGRDSQSLITGARLAAIDDPTYVCNWKTTEGFVQLAADQLKAIATAIRAHVQKCFDREGELLEAVKAGTYTEEMLSEGWPE